MRIFTAALICSAIALAGCGEKVEEPQAGRYRVYQSGNDAVLLDTATGKSWMKVYAENRRDKPDYWEPMARQNVPEEWQAFERLHVLNEAENSN